MPHATLTANDPYSTPPGAASPMVACVQADSTHGATICMHQTATCVKRQDLHHGHKHHSNGSSWPVTLPPKLHHKQTTGCIWSISTSIALHQAHQGVQEVDCCSLTPAQRYKLQGSTACTYRRASVALQRRSGRYVQGVGTRSLNPVCVHVCVLAHHWVLREMDLGQHCRRQQTDTCSIKNHKTPPVHLCSTPSCGIGCPQQ